MLSESK